MWQTTRYTLTCLRAATTFLWFQSKLCGKVEAFLFLLSPRIIKCPPAESQTGTTRVKKVTCERWAAGKCWQRRSFTPKTKEKRAGWVRDGVRGCCGAAERSPVSYSQLVLRVVWSPSVGEARLFVSGGTFTGRVIQCTGWWEECVGLFISSPPVRGLRVQGASKIIRCSGLLRRCCAFKPF